MAFAKKEIRKLGKDANILDVGCGEGLLVEEFSAEGYRISGIDPNYESDYVKLGSVLNLPCPDDSMDAVLLLDVFEHVPFEDQPKALQEIRRVLKPGGILIASIPNLAHLNSRFCMFFCGKLHRTDIETNHVGERPIRENLDILRKMGFRIVRKKGTTLTVPFIYRRLIYRRPSWFMWLHGFLEWFAIPSIAMTTLLVCVNQKSNGREEASLG
jgi:2-polyprenyl-3-methyl-5-hydroxy-6-metoxy-1,4-benzoquinol methylase